MSRAILYDSTLCIDCKACESRLRRTLGPPLQRQDCRRGKDLGAQVDRRHSAWGPISRRLCMHCAEPTCVSVLPRGGLAEEPRLVSGVRRREVHGLPLLPAGVPVPGATYEWNKRLPKMRKCDMCYERQSQGKQTACAEACPNRRHEEWRPRRNCWGKRGSA